MRSMGRGKVGALVALGLVVVACATSLPPVGEPPPLLPDPIPSASVAPVGPLEQPEQPEARPAPVVVALVVDQLAAWVAQERWPELPKGGGFARLRAEGTWVVDARHPHAATDTAPGHAMLFTGAAPADSGIFANEAPEGAGRASILRDGRTRLVGAQGALEGAGSSLARLRVATVADRLKEQHPESLVVGVSLKDRGALFGCGRSADACLWFDPGTDGFVTSTAFARGYPAWAREVGSPGATARAREKPWTVQDEGWLRAHATTPDDQPGEGDWGGLGRVFPHVFSNAKQASSAFRASPVGDERVLTLAAAALQDPRVGKVPTLLAVSLSSNDYVGHIFGPESWESWENLRRLDGALGVFFKALDLRLGPTGYAVVLSADHGVTALPETHGVAGARPWCKQPGDRWQRSCVQGGRLSMEGLRGTLEEAAARALGRGPWLAGLADPYLFLTPAGRDLKPERRRLLLDALRKAASKTPCVERIEDVRARPEVCPPFEDESVDALLCRSMPRGADLEFYVLPRAGCFFDSDYVSGYGTSHGTPWLYDRAVPVLARAPGRIAQGCKVDTPASTSLFGATLAALLGIDPPPALVGARSLASPAALGSALDFVPPSPP